MVLLSAATASCSNKEADQAREDEAINKAGGVDLWDTAELDI